MKAIQKSTEKIIDVELSKYKPDLYGKIYYDTKTGRVIAHSKARAMMISVEPGVDIIIQPNCEDDDKTATSYTLKSINDENNNN